MLGRNSPQQCSKTLIDYTFSINYSAAVIAHKVQNYRESIVCDATYLTWHSCNLISLASSVKKEGQYER